MEDGGVFSNWMEEKFLVSLGKKQKFSMIGAGITSPTPPPPVHTIFKCTFMDLIEKHQIQDIMKPEEYNGLKSIFETYYKDNINKVREQQQASTSI